MLTNINIISLQVNSKCNLCCKHCVAEDLNEENGEAKLDLLKKRIIFLAKYGLNQVVIILKEPLLYQDIFNLISFCSKKGIETEIITNGTLLSYNNTVALIESGINVINISLEGITNKSNDYIRGNGSFDAALKGLNLLQNEFRARKIFKPIIIKMTINSQNKKEWYLFVKYFEKLGVNEVILNSITIAGRAQKYEFLKINDNEFEELVDLIYQSYSTINKPSYVLFIHSLRPLAYIYFNIKYFINSMVCFPDCVSNNGGFSMDKNGIIYSCSENKRKFHMSDGQIKSIPYTSAESHDEINYFLQSNKDFNSNRDKINMERRNIDCLKCIWRDRCNPCQFLTDAEVRELEKKCLNYKEKILTLLKSILYVRKGKIVLKDSAYIYIKDKQYKFVNCYQNGKHLVSSKFDFSNWEQIIIEMIIEKQAYIITKEDLANKEFLAFVFNLVITDCFYVI